MNFSLVCTRVFRFFQKRKNKYAKGSFFAGLLLLFEKKSDILILYERNFERNFEMDILTVLNWIFACFMILATLDRIFGNRFGVGKEMEKGVMLLGTMTISMVGMIVLAPVIANLLMPLLTPLQKYLHLEPSVIMGSLLANDMGGAPLAKEVASSEVSGYFNGLVVASMLGATVSFTIPLALGVIDKSRHKDVALGMLCGIITIPVGCLVSGLMLKMTFAELALNLIPLIIFSGLIALGLALAPNGCVKVFTIFGKGVQILVAVGLAVGIFFKLTGITLIPGIADFDGEGMKTVVNACVVMTGAFPLVYILSKILQKPLVVLGKLIGINATSAMGLISCLATNVTTINMVSDMDKKGVVLNMSFAVSGAFVFAGHLAYTMSFNGAYLIPVIVGKLVAGVSAVILANFVYNKMARSEKTEEVSAEAEAAAAK